MTTSALPQTEGPDMAAIATQNDAFRMLACLGIAPDLVLSRFSSGLFRAMFAMKEIENGTDEFRRDAVRMATTSGLT